MVKKSKKMSKAELLEVGKKFMINQLKEFHFDLTDEEIDERLDQLNEEGQLIELAHFLIDGSGLGEPQDN